MRGMYYSAKDNELLGLARRIGKYLQVPTKPIDCVAIDVSIVISVSSEEVASLFSAEKVSALELCDAQLLFRHAGGVHRGGHFFKRKYRKECLLANWAGVI